MQSRTRVKRQAAATHRAPLAVAVTGGIGSGKTEASRQFRLLGAAVISADETAKRLSETDPEVRSDIRAAFGADAYLPGGSLNREKIASIVFRDPRALRKLNGIVHPRVHRYLRDAIAEERASPKAGLIVVEAALVYESGAETLFDYVIMIASDRQQCIRRIMERDGMARSEVARRIAAQMPQEKKMRKADFIIWNTGSKEQLVSTCTFLYGLLTSWKSAPTT